MKNGKKFLMILFLTVSLMNAQDFNDALRLSEPGISSGPRALGMGNAYTALSNDLSAGIFNPAGFGLIKKLEFDGAISYNSFDNNTTFFGTQTDNSNSWTRLSQFGFAFPVPTARGSLVFSIGFNQLKDFNGTYKFNGYNPGNNSMIQDLTFSPFKDDNDFTYNLGLSYPLYDTHKNYLGDTTLINGKLNQSGRTIQEGYLNSWSFGGAAEVEKGIFVGAQINVISGTLKSTSDYWEEGSLANYPSNLLLDPTDPRTAGFESFYKSSVLKWDISGWDAKIGLLAQINESFNLGATIQFPRTYTIKESYSVFGISNFKNYTFAIDPNTTKSEYDVTTPYEFTLGGAFHIRHLTISADAKLIDYTQMEFSDGLDPQTRADNNSQIKDLFRTVVNLNAGAEYVIPRSGVALRAGFIYMPSPFKDDPSDYDKKYITLGAGFALDQNLTLDIGFAHGWWKDFGDNYSSYVSTTFQDISYNNLIFGLKYIF